MVERKFGGHTARTAAPSAVAKERILLVDPDDDTRTMYREWFQQSGCEVVEAIDGREALAEALIRPPAFVICEIRLPFIDGHALCEILRRDYETARIPILVVTSDGRTAELARARAAGASAVLVKPATPEQLLQESTRLFAVAAAPSFVDRILNVLDCRPMPRRCPACRSPIKRSPRRGLERGIAVTSAVSS